MRPDAQTPALPPPPPTAPPTGVRATGPIGVAVVCALAWAVSAAFAFRHLSPYPPRNAAAILALVAVPIALLGFLIGHLANATARACAMLGAVVLCVALAFAMTTYVPGVAQPEEHPIPGGPTLAVCAAPDGTWDLYLMRHGVAAQLVTLTDTPTPDECWPHLSPDGSRIAYSVQNPDGSADVFLMDLRPDGRPISQTFLVSGGRRELSVTTWAPGGDLLVQSTGQHGPPRIVRVDPATAAVTPFLRVAANASYSPDGSRIAYSAPRRGDPQNWDIWTASADGSDAQDVIDTGGTDYGPAWSPDGSALVFTSDVHGDTDVYAAGANGEDVVDLTASSRDRDGAHGWTPDGHVLFLSNRSHTGGTFLYVMDADGQDVQLALRI